MSWKPLDISGLGKVPRFDVTTANAPAEPAAAAAAGEQPAAAASTSAPAPVTESQPKGAEKSIAEPEKQVAPAAAEPAQAESAVAPPVDAQPAAAPEPTSAIARPPTPSTTTASVPTAITAASMSNVPNSRARQTPPTSGSSAGRPDPQPSTSSAIAPRTAASSSIHNGPAAAPTAAGPSPAASSSRLPPAPKSSPGHGYPHMSTGGKPPKPVAAPLKSEMDVDELADSSGLSDADSSEDDGPIQARYPAPSTSAATAVPAATPSGTPKKRPRESVGGGKGGGRFAALEHFAAADSPLPRYTVIRASGSNKYNVIRINKGITDGDRARWPSAEECRNGHTVDGRPNWKEAIPLDEGRNKLSRIAVGKMLAGENLLNEKVKTAGGKDDMWILEDWPENYNFYLHHFRTKAGQDRDVDTYIFGTHAGASFRTANEITPHIFWLLTHTTSGPMICGCKFCSKKLQGDVNQVLGLITDHRGSPRASSSAPVNKKPRFSASSVLGTIKVKKDKDPERKKKKHKLANGGSALAHGSAGTHAPTYDGAYTDPTREHDLGEGALFRSAEMVWVDLPTPLLDRRGDPARAITRWPAMVVSRTTVSKATAYDKGAPGKAPQLSVIKSWQYSCRLLALTDTITRAEGEIRPWLGYESTLPNEPESIIAPDSVKLVYDGRSVHRPSLKQITSVRLGATPYALALQIAAHVLASFCLNDRYKIENSHIIALPGLSVAEKADLNQQLERNHYHSIFWGAEKIWNGELVRMMVDATVIPPNSSELSPGAKERALFIKISGVYKDSETGSGNISGSMYELADVAHVGAVGASVVGGSAMSQFEKKRPGANPPPEDLFMPEPPPGYFFRRLTPPGEEIHLDVEYIAGRYYPLPIHLHAKKTLDSILASLAASAVVTPEGPAGDGDLDENSRAVVLAGLVPAHRTYMKCYTWVMDRRTAARKAEEEARGEMSRYLNSAMR